MEPVVVQVAPIPKFPPTEPANSCLLIGPVACTNKNKKMTFTCPLKKKTMVYVKHWLHTESKCCAGRKYEWAMLPWALLSPVIHFIIYLLPRWAVVIPVERSTFAGVTWQKQLWQYQRPSMVSNNSYCTTPNNNATCVSHGLPYQGWITKPKVVGVTHSCYQDEPHASELTREYLNTVGKVSLSFQNSESFQTNSARNTKPEIRGKFHLDTTGMDHSASGFFHSLPC